MSIAQFLAIIGLALQLVKQAESLLPAQGSGAQKLAFVEQALRTVYDALGEGASAFDQVWPGIKRMIDMAVAAANAIGWFKRA